MAGPNEVIVCTVCKSHVRKGDEWVPITVWDAYKIKKYEGVCDICEKIFGAVIECLAAAKKEQGEEQGKAQDEKEK
jgi:hypothetical protein